jgi:hypothetical protein
MIVEKLFVQWPKRPAEANGSKSGIDGLICTYRMLLRILTRRVAQEKPVPVRTSRKERLVLARLIESKERVRERLMDRAHSRQVALRWALRNTEGDTALDSKVRALVVLIADVLLANSSSMQAYRIYKRIYRRGDPQGRAAWKMLQALLKQKRYRAAASMVKVLEPNAERYKSLYLYDAEIQSVLGNASEAQKSFQRWSGSADGRSNWRGQIVAAYAAHAHVNRDNPIRHIAIGGVSFNGSTIFGIAMGSIEGVENCGESVWLKQRRTIDGETRIIDYDRDDPADIQYCRICGPTCKVVTNQFRRALVADPVNWYEKLADQYGGRRLVTSDKSVLKYWQLDPLSRYDLIILYKSPTDSTRSHFKKIEHMNHGGWALQKGAHLTVKPYLDNWTQNYFGLLRNVRPLGRRLVINWEAFVADPDAHMRVICSQLALDYDRQLFSKIRPQHVIAGNRRIPFAEIMSKGKLVMQPLNARVLTPAEQQDVDSHQAAKLVFRFLESEYHRIFRF